MKITLRQMEIFLEVAKTGHLTHVANELGLSQSAVSMSIKELESTMGCKLFDRIQKKLVLNEKGRAFAHEIEPLVQKLKDIEEEFSSQDNKGELIIAASTTIADYIMPHIICEYMQRYPEVKISMKIGNTKEIIEMIENGVADLGYIEGAIDSTCIVEEVMGVDELVIVTGDKNLKKRKEYYIDNLLDKKWILREIGSGTRAVFLDKIRRFVPDMNIFLELAHTEAIKSVLMKLDDSLSCLSKIAVQKEIERGELFEIKLKGFDFEREFLQLYHKDKYKSELFKKFMVFARYRFGEIIKS
ncbi:LysR substrate-binding domain-containing protein [Nitrosophilus alvini]|uniref:LysR substrate-binding domain-containing protein n=1 Tax=Nitrosophilus alvini TaxID=2714855 RepID=UPI00190E117A|nr:LysR substrate-binding domain-containing protein [Nitrosophilus alvini]